MPIHFHHNSSVGITQITLSGTLTRLDYRRVMPYLESLIVDYGKLNLLLVFDRFEGWAPAELQGEALSRLGELNDVSKLAICSDPQWSDSLSEMAHRSCSAACRIFCLREVKEAFEWLASKNSSALKSPLSAI